MSRIFHVDTHIVEITQELLNAHQSLVDLELNLLFDAESSIVLDFNQRNHLLVKHGYECLVDGLNSLNVQFGREYFHELNIFEFVNTQIVAKFHECFIGHGEIRRRSHHSLSNGAVPDLLGVVQDDPILRQLQ